MIFRILTLISAALVASGCQHQSPAQQQSAALSLGADSLGVRQMQMRRFDTKDEAVVLGAASGVLQDLGFTIEETSSGTGLIIGSKDRDAIEAGQVASQIILAGLIAALGGRADPTWDLNQKIRISVATRPTADRSGMIARVTFQRVIWNNKNQVSRIESIENPLIYQEFFERLSQAAFLEAHQI